MKGLDALSIVAAILALMAGRKSTTNTGYTPLVDTPPSGTPTGGGGILQQYPTPATTTSVPPSGFSDFSTKLVTTPPASAPAGGLTGLTIKTLDATPTSTSSSNIGSISSPALKTPAGTWTWRTPQGDITSRPPTQEEQDSGLGCPEVPDIWTYPGQSQQDLRYCQNPECPSNKPWTDISGDVLAPTPAVLEEQYNAAGQKSYYCRVCRTIQ